MAVDTRVRVATADDIGALITLESEARSGLREVRGGPERLGERPEIGAAWNERAAGVGGVLFVAEVDSVVFGWLWLEDPDDAGIARISDVYVHPGARDLGLGDDLLDAAMTQARITGAKRLESWALPGDRDTKNLFERGGLTARLIVVSRRLDS